MTKLSQLKIDPEFQNQINPPSFEETHQLEMNILKEERVLNPIITWNGYIVDGHTRYQVLRKYPFIPFEVIEKEFSSRYEALVWICKNQLGRRNLTPEQKKFLIGKQAEAEKQIKSFHGNQYTETGPSSLDCSAPTLDEWSAFATFLADVIEKYVSVLEIDNAVSSTNNENRQDTVDTALAA